MIGAHWYACIMALEASMHDNPAATWLGESRYGFCYPEVVALLVNSTGLTSTVTNLETGLDDCRAMSVGSFYLASFSWSIMVITGTGGTDFYPSSLSDAETAIVVSLVIFGALLWTQVLALFCDVSTSTKPSLQPSLQGTVHVPLFRAHP